MKSFFRSVLVLVPLFAGANALAEPAASASRPLFVLERNRNANFVQYDAKVTGDGSLQVSDPIDAYWIMAAEDRRKEPLTMIERQLAYGFSTNADKRGNVWLTLVAYKKVPIRVFRDASGVHAELPIAGHRAYLTKLFVQAGPEFIPKVTYIDVTGVDAKSGAVLTERLTP